MDVRLILDPPGSGSRNMAVDEVLLESASRGQSVLRFYAWQTPTLSLGYFQPYRARQEHSASAALEVVRRSTGGGAIVHEREITYSFAMPIAQRFSAAHRQLVRTFHETLCESLANWKIAANLYNAAPVESPQRHQVANSSFLCFQRRADDDVVVSGCKIAGSAQRRRRNGILQHGSVLLATSAFAPELSGIEEMVPASPPGQQELIEAWTDRLADRLGARMVDGRLSQEECHSTNNRQKEKYETEEWLHRR